VAKHIREKGRTRKASKDDRLPLSRENFIIMGVGVVAILAGYVAMLEGSVEGFLPLVVAPILLVVGYCVILPVGILYRKGMFKVRGSEGSQQGVAGKSSTASA
jgi:hypothetical protein